MHVPTSWELRRGPQTGIQTSREELMSVAERDTNADDWSGVKPFAADETI
jgi:hypothetical protein